MPLDKNEKNGSADGEGGDTARTRRDLLKDAGSIAAYVAPAMVVLIEGDRAAAQAPRPPDWFLERLCREFPNHRLCVSTV